MNRRIIGDPAGRTTPGHRRTRRRRRHVVDPRRRGCGRRRRARSRLPLLPSERAAPPRGSRQRSSIHFTGRPSDTRGERERGLLAPDVDLLPERAADVADDHVDARRVDAEHAREVVARACGRPASRSRSSSDAAPDPSSRRCPRVSIGTARYRCWAMVSVTTFGAVVEQLRRARERRLTRRSATTFDSSSGCTRRSVSAIAARGCRRAGPWRRNARATSSHASSAPRAHSATTMTIGSPTKQAVPCASGRRPTEPSRVDTAAMSS